MRGGGLSLPLLFLVLLGGACHKRPPLRLSQTLPQQGDPLVIKARPKASWWVGMRDGSVWMGPPWKKVYQLPPGQRAYPLPEGFLWVDTTGRKLLKVSINHVETLLSIPDTTAVRIWDVRADEPWLLVRLSSRLLLRRDTSWWTLPFWGQTADIRADGRRVVLVYADRHQVFKTASTSGASWAVPDTLLNLPFPVMEVHILQNGGVLAGWNTHIGPPRGFFYIPPEAQDSARWLVAAPKGITFVATQIVETPKRLMFFSTLMDTTFQPLGVTMKVFHLQDMEKLQDTLILHNAWLYGAAKQGKWVVITAAGNGKVYQLRIEE